jgi:hypothetical protein
MLGGNFILYIQFLESVPCYIAYNILIRNYFLRIPIVLYFIEIIDSHIYTDYEIDIYVRKSECGDAKEDDVARIGARGPKYKCAKWR